MPRSTGEETVIAEVAVNAPLERLFHYSVPPELRGRLQRGHRVLVSFGRRTATGVCVGFPLAAQVPELKPIREILHPESRFDEHLLALTRWIAAYYRAPWGEVLEAALPPAIRAGKRERGARTVAAAASAGDLLAAAGAAKRSPGRAGLLALLAREAGPHLEEELPALLGVKRAAARAAVRAAVAAGLAACGE